MAELIQGEGRRKALIYMRCSTDEDRQNVDTQLDKCKKFVESKGWDYEIGREYSSAWNKPRPIFKHYLARFKKGEFQVWVSFDMDRFSRDDPHVADSYLNTIVQESNARFISLNDSIDSDDDIKWNIVRHIMVWQANKYSERLSNRIKDGINFKKKKDHSYKHGRKRKADYGAIIKLYKQGLSLSRIARELNVNKSSVFNAIKNVTTRKEKAA